MGLIALNLSMKGEPLKKADLTKAGIAILIRDVEEMGVVRASAILSVTPEPSAPPTMESNATPIAPDVPASDEPKPG